MPGSPTDRISSELNRDAESLRNFVFGTAESKSFGYMFGMTACTHAARRLLFLEEKSIDIRFLHAIVRGADGAASAIVCEKRRRRDRCPHMVEKARTQENRTA